jgi:hypothetical protein
MIFNDELIHTIPAVWLMALCAPRNYHYSFKVIHYAQQDH